MFFPRASNKTLRNRQYFRAPVMEQVLFKICFPPPITHKYEKCKRICQVCKKLFVKSCKRNTFSPNTNSASQCQQFKLILKAFLFLEYISSIWNILPLFGIYFLILEYISSFWNIFPLFGIYPYFWNIFSHQTVLNHEIYRLIQ